MNDLGATQARRRSSPGLVSRVLRWRPLRFLFVGGISFLVDFTLLFVLHELVGMMVWLAAGISFVASFVVNYTLQRRISFDSNAPHGSSLVRYLVLVGANTIVTGLLMQMFASISIGWALGKVITTVITSVVNYFVYKHWVFPSSRNRPSV